ncbi:unnamed protein product, partial [Nesidiocoris tenuis]
SHCRGKYFLVKVVEGYSSYENIYYVLWMPIHWTAIVVATRIYNIQDVNTKDCLLGGFGLLYGLDIKIKVYHPTNIMTIFRWTSSSWMEVKSSVPRANGEEHNLSLIRKGRVSSAQSREPTSDKLALSRRFGQRRKTRCSILASFWYALIPTILRRFYGTCNSFLYKMAVMGLKVDWPVKKSAEIAGDVVLGGLMMVHEREDTITCGPVMPQGGVQAVETMLYTLDIVNNHSKWFKIGAHILDDCDKDTYGLEMAVDFIKGSISNLDDAELTCNKTQVRKVISGVVGAASSVTSVQVANLLRLFKIPQVSYFSTSPELSNKQRFEYFTRTIPSDRHQVQAMVELVNRLGWSYVSVIYEESNYGVIIFGSDQEVAELMRAVRRCNATGSFSWIGSDGWSARDLVSNGNERQVEGTLSVQPQANPVVGFEDYFLSLTVDNNKRNPWFIEFWEDHFKCRYPNSTPTPYNIRFVRECTPNDKLNKKNVIFENQLQFVSDAVMALSVALIDMHRDLCGNNKGVCSKMSPTKGSDLLKYLRKVKFEGLSGDKFHFDNNGDGPARYNIVHFKQVSPGSFQWVNVGEYVEGELRLNMSEVRFHSGTNTPPESVCSLPCQSGQAKKYVEGERCCWYCFNCTRYQAAGRELSYVLLSGIFLCYSITFLLVLRPTDVVCAFQRFGVGFCFTVVYSALFTKTNRIARIFKAGKKTTKRPNFISPKSQLIICSCLISVQIIINLLWMIVSPPKASYHYPTREDNLLVCSSFIDTSYMIAFAYPILLIVVCTVYAVLTRNIPEAFNESKHIGFTMYTTCIIWLAFVPLYFVTNNHMPLRITSMSVTINLSASVTVVCLFSPKVRIRISARIFYSLETAF